MSVQLRDTVQGRLVKLDLWVTDAEITTRVVINHRRMNYIDSDSYEEGDSRRHYWDME